ncbi:MAG: RDD family protein [bacterium]|nr:RDD family protein [bacterium]
MKSEENAYFIKRLGALILDMIIVSIVVSMLTFFVNNNSNYEKLTKEYNDVMEQAMDKKTSPKEYKKLLSKASDISYDLSKQTVVVSFVSLTMYILYFIVFQFYNKGQTIGKKLMKIKIESNYGKDLTMNQLAVRSLIINSILANLILLAVIILGSKDVYFVSSMTVSMIQYIIIFTTAIMILFRKDKRGLHDVITNTKVINEKIEV